MAAVTRHLRPEPGVTEIRVHGVGGTTPEALLDQTGVRQATGDDKAGMFRGAIPQPGRTVEAYSWGGLTARSRSRAFWVLLVPFSLVNLSGWMVEPPRKEGTPQTHERTGGIKWHEVFVQLIAVTATAMYVMWVALISMNVLAFQCAGIAECRRDRWYLEPFNSGFFVDHAGRRIVAGLILPLALLGFFWLLGRISRSRYDDYGEDERTIYSSDAPEEAGSAVGLTSFWHTSYWQAGVARIHVAVVLFILAGLLGRAAVEFERHFQVEAIADTAGRAVFLIALVASLVAAVGLVAATWRSGRLLGTGVRWFSTFSQWTLVAGMILMAVAVALTWQLDVADAEILRPRAGLTAAAPPTPNTDLWGFGWAPILLLGAGALFVGMFSAVQLWRWFVWRLIHLDQIVVPLMLVFVVLWPQASWVALAAAAVAVAVHFLPGWAARMSRQPETELAEGAGTRLGLFLGVCVVAAVVARLTAGAGSPYGADWPRVTPVLLFTALLALLNVWQTGGRRLNNAGPRSALRVRTAIMLIPAGLVLVGLFLQDVMERAEWYHGAAWLAWTVMAVVWLAQFRYDGWRWNGPAAVAVLGLSITMGAFSGLVIWVVDLLDRGGDLFVLRATGLYEWLTVAFAVMLIAIVAGALAWFSLLSLGIDVGREDRSAGKGEVLPELVNAADVILTVAAMLLVSGVAALLLHLDATYGNQYQAWIDDTAPSDWRGIVQVASWIALGVSVGAYFVLRNGLKDHGLRRQFGILWDVASFWPRSFHPFAPPSYAVRAVPELQARVTEVTTAAAVRDDPSAAGSSAGAAIVSGHSQGSVLSLATVASLRDDIRPRVRLVTHGSPLGGLYRRFFPRYFPNTLLTYCAAALGPTDDIADGGWLNFWRRTDPIGDAVCDAQDRDRPAGHPPEAVVAALETSPTGATQLPDVRLADPLARTNDFELEPAPRGHSGYMADAAMWRTIDAIAADLDAALANSEFVVMIDDRDCATGVAERTEAHRSGEGMHRAVSVFVFNEEGRLLIQRRSAGKALFAGRWANTCCTHPRPGESAADAAARCLQSELGIRATLEEVGAFAYEAVDPEGGGEERERTRVFVGQTRALPSPNPDEVEQIAWVPMDELQRTMADHPDDYAPWLIEAFTAIPDLAARTEASSPPRPE